MKILYFYRYNKYYNKDEWLHSDFAKAINKHPNIELKVYGMYMEDYCPEITLTPFRYENSMEDLLKLYQPDVMLFCTKSRMFRHYVPGEPIIKGACWLPCGWEGVQIPKVMMEEDYFYEQDDSWYYRNGIKHILQRHYSQQFRPGKCQHIWFPFSVDTEIFKPTLNKPRTNKICFIGSCDSAVYKYRKLAIEKLQSENLIDIFSKGEKTGMSYVDALQEYVCYLVGTLTHDITPAKIFEIAAMGGALLINEAPNGVDKLFPNHSYYTHNPDNICEVARDILNNKEKREAIIQASLETCQTLHSHTTRVNELYLLLKSLFNIKN